MFNSSRFVYVDPKQRIYSVAVKPKSWSRVQFYTLPFQQRSSSSYENAMIGFVDRQTCLQLVYDIRERKIVDDCECVETDLDDIIHISQKMLYMPLLVIVEYDSLFFKPR